MKSYAEYQFQQLQRRQYERHILWVRVWAIVLALVVGLAWMCWGAEPPQDLWKGLIGEAVSEGYDGMYAVACVYRNRLKNNMPLGCVALKRKDLDKFVALQGAKYEMVAKSIVEEVFYKDAEDITQGATHYENIKAFGVPYWAKDMKVVCKIGVHTFYKPKSAN